jgi:hypothetical protein
MTLSAWFTGTPNRTVDTKGTKNTMKSHEGSPLVSPL